MSIAGSEFYKWLKVFGVTTGGGGGGSTPAQIQQQAFTYAVDSGVANAYVVALTPALTSYGDGDYICFKATHTNTSATTINVNGLGAKAIVTNANVALGGGEILINGDYLLVYNSIFGKFVLINSSLDTDVTAAQIQQQAFTYAVDSGAANAYVVTLSPAPSALTDGLLVAFKSTNANSGATTINVNGLGAISIKTNANAALIGGEILVNGDYLLMYNSIFTAFVLVNSSLDTDVTAAQIQQQAFTYAADTGIANAYFVTLSPAPASLTDGLFVAFKAANANNSSCTMDVNSLGLTPIVDTYNNPLITGAIQAGGDYILIYNNTFNAFVLFNSSLITPAAIEKQQFTYAVDIGAANAYVVNLAPAPSGFIDGMYVVFKAANTNSGATTINLNAHGTMPILTNSGSPLVGGEILANGSYILLFNSSLSGFILVNSSLDSDVTAAQIQNQAFTYAADSGAANAYAVTLSPAPSAYVDGLFVCFKPANTNTGGSTINVNGLGLANIHHDDATALIAGDILVNGIYFLVYDTLNGGFVLINPSATNNLVASQIQQQQFTYAPDTGAVNALIAAIFPVPAAYTDGMYIAVNAGHTNTSATTINVNGLGIKNIVTNANAALVGGELLINGDYILMYNAIFGAFVLINSSLSSAGVTAAQIQDQAFTYGVDSGAANAYVVTLSPAPSSLTDGMYVVFKAANANSAASTVNVNGLGATNIVTNTNASLVGGEILAGGDYILMYNSTFSTFVLINSSLSSGGGVTAAQIQQQAFTYAVDSGAANAYVIAPSPAYTSLIDGMYVCFRPSNSNTGASTINVNGLGVIPIHYQNTTLAPGAILLSQIYILVYSSALGLFNLINPSNLATFSNMQRQTPTYAVSTGSANAYILTLSTAPIAYLDGTYVCFRPNFSNTGATTINVNSLGAKSIVGANGAALIGGEILNNEPVILIYSSSGGQFHLVNSSTFFAASQIQKQAFIYAVDSGAANAYAVTLSPAPTSYTDGMIVVFRAANANTGTSTINVNGLGTKNIATNFMISGNLGGGEILSGRDYILIYTSLTGVFSLINPTITAPQIQKQTFTYAVDSGVANAYVLTLSPTPTAYVDGMYVAFTTANANTGATTVNVNGLGAVNIVTNANAALIGGEILTHGQYLLMYNNSFSAFVLINSSSSAGATAAQIQQQSFTYSVDSGVVNAYVVTLSPAPSAYTDGMYLCFRPTNSNTGASTINVNGLGVKNILGNNGGALSGGELLVNGDYILIYNSALNAFTIANSSAGSGGGNAPISSVISSGSAISLTNVTPADVTSITVGIGKWLICGNINFNNTTTSLTDIIGWISSTSATLPDKSLYNRIDTSGSSIDEGISAPTILFTATSPTTIYLSCRATFAFTTTACGAIYAIPT